MDFAHPSNAVTFGAHVIHQRASSVFTSFRMRSWLSCRSASSRSGPPCLPACRPSPKVGTRAPVSVRWWDMPSCFLQWWIFSSSMTLLISGTSALLHRQGIPAPHMQPNSSSQARSGWFLSWSRLSNRISASISGASAGVRPPSGMAAG